MIDAPVENGSRALIIGYARTGQAVARVLVARGVLVTAIDDAPTDAAREEAARVGVDLVRDARGQQLKTLISASPLIVASPGVPPSHPAMLLAPPESLVSEIELAYRLSSIPIVAVTGTNGKTTVTSLVAAMLNASGMRARALGNIGQPLVEGVLAHDLDVLVAEVSSFQLAYTTSFRPTLGTWLNVAQDHLDWHRDFNDYVSSKERIWAEQEAGDVAVANAEDPIVKAATLGIGSRVVTFGRHLGDYHISGDDLVGPGDEKLIARSELQRRFPHDETNALAALATARNAGGTTTGCADALVNARPLPHRVAFVATIGGISYFNDSKATTPSAVTAALQAFERVVLIAGGRNKGTDLAVLRPGATLGSRTTMVGVVAIGEAAVEVANAFDGVCPVVRAGSMDDAVRAATRLGADGDTVLLSPGCASFDWYRSYEERGEDFVRAVRGLMSSTTASTVGGSAL